MRIEKLVRIEKLLWKLDEFCPVCGQGSSLTFLTCPECSRTIIACDEEGTVFPNPGDLTEQAETVCDVWISTYTRCPHCAAETELRFSTEEEVRCTGLRESASRRPTILRR